MTEDMFGLGKLSDNGIELIKTIYPDAIQPSARKIGKALETVFGLGNTILLPVKLLNEKTNLLFQKGLGFFACVHSSCHYCR